MKKAEFWTIRGKLARGESKSEFLLSPKKVEGWTDGTFYYYKNEISGDWCAIVPGVGASVADEKTRRDVTIEAHRSIPRILRNLREAHFDHFVYANMVVIQAAYFRESMKMGKKFKEACADILKIWECVDGDNSAISENWRELAAVTWRNIIEKTWCLPKNEDESYIEYLNFRGFNIK